MGTQRSVFLRHLFLYVFAVSNRTDIISFRYDTGYPDTGDSCPDLTDSPTCRSREDVVACMSRVEHGRFSGVVATTNSSPHRRNTSFTSTRKLGQWVMLITGVLTFAVYTLCQGVHTFRRWVHECVRDVCILLRGLCLWGV
jgi:hypothetical protein